MANRTLEMTDALYNYLLAISLREPPILSELRSVTAQLKSHQMQIAPEQGQFITFLLKLINAQTALEIGTYTGYSALCIAYGLPAQGKLITCDIDNETTAIAQTYWQKANMQHKIALHLAPASLTLTQLIAQHTKFDFIFIDANKKSYLDYYEKALQLLNHNGVIMIDNIFMNGRVLEPVDDAIGEAMNIFNQYVHNDKRVEITTIPMGDGITLVKKL